MGTVAWKLFNADGTIADEGEMPNKITTVGDQYYAERASGIASPPAQVTGMRLGTGTTTEAKSGAGAALVTYLTNSNQAIDGGFPTSAVNGSYRRISWQCTFAAGKATTSGTDIAEVVLVNDTIATNATSSSGNTIARAKFGTTTPKASDQVLVVTWNHDIGTP